MLEESDPLPKELNLINNRYILHKEIGQGGMGVVHLATDRLTKQQVALKQVHVHFTESGWVIQSQTPYDANLKFLLTKEFQILASLRHPHIISVLDYGFDHAHHPYYTMTYLDQAKTILEAGAVLNLSEKIALIQQMLQALSYLHRRGILHRDLKPNNVLVSNGQLRLVDFGLASTKGQDGSTAGTILYMPPEIFIRGNRLKYIESTDLYSVGVIAYQLFAGEHPFDVDSVHFVQQVLASPPDLSRLGVNEALAKVVGRLLAKKPEERYQRASDCINELNEAIGEEAVEQKAIRDSFLQAAKFVGRKDEMAKFAKALAMAKDGHGSAWLLGGESGVGKSRLLREIQTQALVSGFQLLHGQGVKDGNGGAPYQLWREPIRHLLITLSDVDELTAGVIMSLVADIEQLLECAVKPAPELANEDAQIRLFTTIASLFWQVKRPILLILEDLHWVSESLNIIPYLTRLISDYPVVIIGSYRQDERPDLPERLLEMTHVKLPLLTETEVAELSVAMLGEAGGNQDVVNLIQRETEGNTFFAVEVVRALAENAGRLANIGQIELPETLLPNGIKDIVHRRLEKLPGWARTLLVKTAVAGRELDIPLIQQLGKDIDVQNKWLSLCLDAVLLDVHNGIWQFSHGKIRDGLLSEMSLAEKRQRHTEVALAIEHLYPSDVTFFVRLTYHWREAGDSKKEAHYALGAGEQAAEQYAHHDALRYFKRVLLLTQAENDLEQQYKIHSACLRAYSITKDIENEQTTLHTLTSLADRLNDKEKQGSIQHLQVNYYLTNGQFDQAIPLFSKTVAFALEHHLPLLELQIFLDWAYLLASKRHIKEAFEKIERARQLLNQLDARLEQIRFTNVMGILHLYEGDIEKSLSYLQESLKLSQSYSNPEYYLHALINTALSYRLIGEFEKSETYKREALLIAQEAGSVISKINIYNNIGIHYSILGEYEQAIAHLKDCLLLCRQVGEKRIYSYALNNIGMAYRNMEQFVQAQKYLQQALTVKQSLNDSWSEAYTWNLLGHLHLNNQQYAQGLTAFQTAESLLVTFNDPVILREAQVGLAIIYAYLDRLQEGQMYAEKVWHYVKMKGFVGEWGWNICALYLYKVFEICGDARAADIIYLAYSELQTRAAKIATDASREKFLTQVSENCEIVQLYEQLTTS